MTPPAAPPGTTDTTRLAEIVFPGHLNAHGTYFAGAALGLMGRAAFVAARRSARCEVVMAACRRSEFCSPVHPGELVEASARVERSGRRSMTVAVEMVAEALTTGERRRAAFGEFEMVVLGSQPSDGVADPGTPANGPEGWAE